MPLRILAFALLVASFAYAEKRQFTFSSGRFYKEAELMGVSNNTASLRLPSSSIPREFPLSSFSAEDQKYIREWVALRTVKPISNLAVRVLRDRAMERENGPRTKSKTEIIRFSIEVTNQSGRSLKAVEMRLNASLVEAGTRMQNRIPYADSITHEEIANGATVVFKPMAIQLNEESRAERTTAGGFIANKSKQVLRDAVVEIYEGSQLIWRESAQ